MHDLRRDILGFGLRAPLQCRPIVLKRITLAFDRALPNQKAWSTQLQLNTRSIGGALDFDNERGSASVLPVNFDRCSNRVRFDQNRSLRFQIRVRRASTLR